MDAVTYPDKYVIDFISDSIIAVRVPSDNKTLAEEFMVKWTPTLVVLGSDGRQHHRTLGFLDPEQLVANILIGEGKYYFNNDKFPEALQSLEKIVAGHAYSDVLPEAIFLRGVSRYKNTDNPQPLRDAYELLNSDYPDSVWCKRAYPYRLIG